MRTSVKVILTALAASLLLSAAISTASARNLSLTNQNFRITWTSLEFSNGAVTRCQVTLEGSFHYRTILKNPRSLIGLITRAIVQRPCIEGTGSAFNGVERYNGTTPANTLPWHVTYEGFTGTLPAIATVLLLLAGTRFGIENLGCAVQVGEATDNVTGAAAREAGGGITTLRPVEGRNIATVIRTDRDPFGLCPRPGNRAGRLLSDGQVFLLGTNNRITVTLI
ncbi:MAG TPA: hypothetical protein VKB03_08890 [Conexibacter sp.]|nr:hypothetical protein [Conexibacter sp.]